MSRLEARFRHLDLVLCKALRFHRLEMFRSHDFFHPDHVRLGPSNVPGEV